MDRPPRRTRGRSQLPAVGLRKPSSSACYFKGRAEICARLETELANAAAAATAPKILVGQKGDRNLGGLRVISAASSTAGRPWLSFPASSSAAGRRPRSARRWFGRGRRHGGASLAAVYCGARRFRAAPVAANARRLPVVRTIDGAHGGVWGSLRCSLPCVSALLSAHAKRMIAAHCDVDCSLVCIDSQQQLQGSYEKVAFVLAEPRGVRQSSPFPPRPSPSRRRRVRAAM